MGCDPQSSSLGLWSMPLFQSVLLQGSCNREGTNSFLYFKRCGTYSEGWEIVAGWPPLYYAKEGRVWREHQQPGGRVCFLFCFSKERSAWYGWAHPSGCSNIQASILEDTQRQCCAPASRLSLCPWVENQDSSNIQTREEGLQRGALKHSPPWTYA